MCVCVRVYAYVRVYVCVYVCVLCVMCVCERATIALESGDSSVVTRWTVDQEVVGSNPTHGGNLISVVRSLSWFTQPIR